MAVGVRLTGTSGNYVSTPDHGDFAFTDFGVVAHLALDDWTPSADTWIVYRYGTAGTRQFLLVMRTTGTLRFYVSEDGTSTSIATCDNAPTGITDGDDMFVGVTLDADNGASNSDVKFWESSDGVSWSQLGATENLGAVVSPHDPTQELSFGSTVGSPQHLYYVAVYDGIGANTAPGQGTLVADWTASESGVRHRDSTGKIWTLNGSAYSTVIDDN